MTKRQKTLKERLGDAASSLVFLVVVFLGLAVGTFGIGVVLIALNYLSTGDYDISRQLTLTEGAGDFLRNILLIVWTLAAILVGYFLGFKAHRKFKMDDLSSKRIQKAKAQIARDTDYVINELERDSKKRIEAAKARIAAREAKALQEAEEAQEAAGTAGDTADSRNSAPYGAAKESAPDDEDAASYPTE